MQFSDELKRYFPWLTGYHDANTARNNIPNASQHTYKPKAIRLFSLLSLFFLFTICLTWLEILLDKTITPSTYYHLNGSNQHTKRHLESRQAQCPSPEENAKSLSSLDAQHSELCVSYTTTFKPFTTDLTPALQGNFDSWLAVYSSMEAQSENAAACASSQSTSSSLSSLLNSLTSSTTSSVTSQSSSTSATQSATPSATASNSQATSTQASTSNTQTTVSQTSTSQTSSSSASTSSTTSATQSSSSLTSTTTTSITTTNTTSFSSSSTTTSTTTTSATLTPLFSNSTSTLEQITPLATETVDTTTTTFSQSSPPTALNSTTTSSTNSVSITPGLLANISTTTTSTRSASITPSLLANISTTTSTRSASTAPSLLANISTTTSTRSASTTPSLLANISTTTSTSSGSITRSLVAKISANSSTSSVSITRSLVANISTTSSSSVSITPALLSNISITTAFPANTTTTSNTTTSLGYDLVDEGTVSTTYETTSTEAITTTATSTPSSFSTNTTSYSSSTTTTDTSTITPAPSCTPGASCSGCEASECTCSDDGTVGPTCGVNTCYCTTFNTDWQCNSVNLCATTTSSDTSTFQSTTTTTTDPASPTCDPDFIQCYGCDPTDAAAPCQCTESGNCQSAPCSSCTFSSDGTIMYCPLSCGSDTTDGNSTYITKRGLHVGHKSESIVAQFGTHTVNNTTGHGPKIYGDLQANEIERAHRIIDDHRSRRIRNIWGVMDKRQAALEPIRDAWNYLLWTEPLTVSRTTSGTVSTTVAATFTLDVFADGSTSFPSLTSTPPLRILPTVPACIPATLISPQITGLAKRDGSSSSVKPYVERDSTTVVVRLRENYLALTSNVPTISKGLAATDALNNALADLSTQTMQIQSVGADGVRNTQNVVVVQPNTIRASVSPTPTDVNLSNGGGGGGDGGGSGSNSSKSDVGVLATTERVVNVPFTAGIYVVAQYIPTFMAIIIKIVFEPMVAAIKMMEPFERLHRSQGSDAESSLLSNYLASSFSFDAIRNLTNGRTITIWTLVIYIMIAASTPISSASMTVRPMERCLIDGVYRNCDPAWVIDLRFIRTLEALLIVCMLLTVVLAWDSWTYHAGVPSNPTSIASMAILMNYEPFRTELQNIDPNATEEEMGNALKHYNFWLLPHNPTRTEMRYGFVHAQGQSTQETNAFARYFKLERIKAAMPHINPHRMQTIQDSLQLLAIFTLLALLTTYRGDLTNDSFNRFFASGTFVPKIVMVTLSTVIDMRWKDLEREVRIIEPYRRLFLGNARPENTILCSLNGTCWSNLPMNLRALFKYENMWFEVLIGCIAILSDVNIIAVAGVLMTEAQTEGAYEFSSVTALACTSIMLVVTLITMFWWRRITVCREMPRIPETVAAVLSYLCSSKMAMDFAGMGMENLSKAQRDEIIIAKGRRYKFANIMGEDGKMRYTVDYDDGDDEQSERSSWLQEKLAMPKAVRSSKQTSMTEDEWERVKFVSR